MNYLEVPCGKYKAHGPKFAERMQVLAGGHSFNLRSSKRKSGEIR
jgi:hypothetical protein